MPGIVGAGTTFNLPNYVGELFAVSPEDTKFLSAIGGLTGGRPADGTLFQWQGYDLRAADDARQRVEGANAPDGESRVRFNVTNVVEIHQETVETTYTKQAATGQFHNTGAGHPGQAGLAGSNPVADEHGWQVSLQLKQIARDVNKSFISGTFANPATNATARKTRGLLGAVTTNVVTNGVAAELTENMVHDAMQMAWENGGLAEGETATLMCNAWQKRMLSKIFIKDKGFQETSRNVGGVNLMTVETDFGRVNIMLERYMPVAELAIVSMEQCAPRFLPIPGKGFLFQEALSKTGASDRTQIYGEIGLEYGNEKAHAKITGLTTAPAA